MGTRLTIVPYNLNTAALAGGVFPVAPAGGIDAVGAGGTNFATAWATGPYTGVQFINNGSMFLWYYNITNAITADILIGQKAGGVIPPYNTYQVSIPTSAQYGWILPVSVQQFTQTDANQAFTGSPSGVIGSAAVGMTCVDFGGTLTNLALRLYQLIPAVP